MPPSARPEPPSPIDPSLKGAEPRPPLRVPAGDWWGSGTTRTFNLTGSDAEATQRAGFRDDVTDDRREPVAEAGRRDSSADLFASLDPNGRYVVGGVIGRGGMGVVHEGWDVQLMRETAVKVLLHEHKGKPEVVRRFLDEARITGRLQHPGVVAIHELGWSPDERPYFVMRMVRGQTLAQILQRRANPSADLTLLLTIFLQVCQAVAYAHSQGIIHRDLKPSNIMVGLFGVVKVMDWGLAKVLGEADTLETSPAVKPAEPPADGVGGQATTAPDPVSTRTLMGTVFGTPAYLSPEQARGEIDRVDQRADVFGLGSILCEILTGLPTYTGADGREVYAKAAHASTAEVIARLNTCPAPLDPVTLAKWCLAAEPADRPADASTVVEVMTAHLRSDQRRAEQDLVRFFDLSLDLFCISDMNGYFVRVNENFHRVLGYETEELVSRPFLEFVHPDDHAKTVRQSELLALGEPCVQFLNRYRHAQGHYLWFEWSAQSAPEERATYAVARDVTARVEQAEAHARAEQSRRHLASVVDSAEIAIYSTALDGTVRSWNPGAERLFGYRPDEVIGRPARRLLPPGVGGDECELPERSRHRERVEHTESARLHKDGTAFPVSLTVSPVRGEFGAVVGASHIVRDIGDRKRSEAEAAKRVRAATFLTAVGAALTRGVGLRESLHNFVRLAIDDLGVDDVQVWTLGDTADVLELQATAGPSPPCDGPRTRSPVGRGDLGRVALERKPHLTNELVCDHGTAVGEEMTAFAGQPLEVYGRLVGVVAVYARQPLPEDTLEILQSVADSLALGIRSQQLEAELRQLRASRANP